MVEGHVLLRQAVLLQRAALAGHHGLVGVDDPVALVLPPGELSLDAGHLFAVLGLVHPSSRFYVANGPLVDLVLPIDLTQQRGVHVCTWELPPE